MAFSKEEALILLQRAVAEKCLGHAYLISGPAGSGTQLLSEELAALVLECGPVRVTAHPDFHVAGPESKSRRILTEQIRELEEVLHRKPQVGSWKVAVIHDADRLMPSAANAFLKTLEEPPEGTLLLLITTLPEALLETIRSRCIALPLRSTGERLREKSEEKMAALMKQFFTGNSPTDATAAFQLTRSFQALLSMAREEAVEAAEAEFSTEKQHYAKTTDGDWADDREEHFKAAAEATALRHRSLLLGAVADHFGSLLRAQHDGSHDGDVAVETGRLLRCVEVVEALRSSLEKGVQEPLALEAGFLELMEAYHSDRLE